MQPTLMHDTPARIYDGLMAICNIDEVRKHKVNQIAACVSTCRQPSWALQHYGKQTRFYGYSTFEVNAGRVADLETIVDARQTRPHSC